VVAALEAAERHLTIAAQRGILSISSDGEQTVLFSANAERVFRV
jgi:hypothetical protein